MNRCAHSSRRRRVGPGRSGLRVGAALLLLTTGCSSVHNLPVDRVTERGMGRTRVVMHDGYTYDFARVAVRSDSLYGTYWISEERIGSEGEVIYEDLARQTVLPTSSVARLEIKRWDPSKSVLLGAGGVLFAIWLKGVVTTEEEEKPEYGNNKP